MKPPEAPIPASNRRPTLLPAGSILAVALLVVWTLLAPDAAAQQQGAGQRTGTRTSGTTYYPSSTEVGQAVVTYDPETRQLIVVSDDETAEQIGQVVTGLDRPAPQVLIKVVFLEVTYRKGLDVGVEASYQKDMGGGNTMNLSQGFTGLPGIDSGAGIFQMLGTEYQVTLKAIAEAGKLEVLSRPTILARNNQQATITVGQQVPLITNVRYDTFGNAINAISYQSVGIILRVTPFITSDGMVEMVVNPEISNLSEDTVPISVTSTNGGALGAPIINTRSADTVVVTPDGQTVVIGGLMQNVKTFSESKIPVLGDIPGLGALFRRRVTNDAKTELLIFLTPHIVKTPAELAAATHTERANRKISPQAFSEEELDRFLDQVPEKDAAPPEKPQR